MKKLNYVAVRTDNGLRLVTDFDNLTRSAYWKDDGEPLHLSKAIADDIAYGLTCNGFTAYVLQSYYAIHVQFRE